MVSLLAAVALPVLPVTFDDGDGPHGGRAAPRHLIGRTLTVKEW